MRKAVPHLLHDIGGTGKMNTEVLRIHLTGDSFDLLDRFLQILSAFEKDHNITGLFLDISSRPQKGLSMASL